MKAKKSKEGGSPLNTYYWICYNKDGSIIYEYDFVNKKYNFLNDINVDQVVLFCYYPFSNKLVDKVKKVFNRDVKQCISDRVHLLEIDVDKGERLRTKPTWRRRISINAMPFSKYAMFKTDDKGNVSGWFIDDHGMRHDS